MVGDDGRFRVAFTAATRTGTLALESRWLYLPERVRVRMRDDPEEMLLEPALGGVLTGRVTLPAARAFEVDAYDSVRVSVWRTDGANFATPPVRLDAEGAFEFTALPPGAGYSVMASGSEYCDSESARVEVRPGERSMVELALELGVSLAGRVLDPNGNGVPGATLTVHVERGVFSSHMSQGESTDHDGAFVLRGLEGGEFTLFASKVGFLDGQLDVGEVGAGERRDGLVLVLEEGSSIEGVVTWPDGRPAEGARVSVEQAANPNSWSSFGESLEVTADPEGRFRISGLAAGTCKIKATAEVPGGERGDPDWVAVQDDVAVGTANLALVLGTGGAVRGTVFDDTGAPLDDFRIVVDAAGSSPFPFNSGEKRSERFRDAAGHFELRGLTDGAWMLYARASGHSDSAPVRVELPHTGDLMLVVARTGTIIGRVVDAGGQPVRSAKVHATRDVRPELGSISWSGDLADASVGTDAAGEFKLRRVPSGKLTVHATHEAHGDSEPLALELAPAGTIEGQLLVLRVAAGLSVAVHPAAAPVAGREVHVQNPASQYFETLSTDGAGRAELGGLSPGTYELTLVPPEDDLTANGEDWLLLQARQHRATVELAAGAREHVVLGEPPARTIRVSGRVTEAGRAVPNALVGLHRFEREMQDLAAARADDEGRFELEVSAPGAYRASVGADWGDQVWFDVEVPDAPQHVLELALPTSRVCGAVLGVDGRAAVGCPVALDAQPAEGEQNLFAQRLTETDSAGRFTFEHVTTGTYTLSAGGASSWFLGEDRQSFGVTQRSGLTVTEGSALEGIELELRAPATLRGSVVGPDGAPVAGVQISVTRPGGQPVSPFPWWQSDAGGGFEIGGLPGGEVHIVARGNGLESAVRELELVEGATASVVLQLETR